MIFAFVSLVAFLVGLFLVIMLRVWLFLEKRDR
jgi:hypothetical protein